MLVEELRPIIKEGSLLRGKLHRLGVISSGITVHTEAVVHACPDFIAVGCVVLILLRHRLQSLVDGSHCLAIVAVEIIDICKIQVSIGVLRVNVNLL